MQYTFADRISSLQPSAIREILKFTADPTVISFAAGNPAPEAFPVKEVAEISSRIFAERPIDALQYSITEGYTPLRDRMKNFMRDRYNSYRDFDELIVTSGAQQVMELTTKALCNEGDTIICEAPSFIGSLNAFRSFGVKLRGVPVESDGIDIAQLEEALKEEKKAKFIYVIPNFQNPSGVTMSLEKRKAVYDLAGKYGVMILEDNPYGELRVKGENIPTIKSMDIDGRVIYAGTFSKVLSPGIRVGYAVAPSPVIQKMVVCKQVTDVHTNIFGQMLADEFMANYDFDAHLEKIRGIYRNKMGLMLDLMKQHLPGSVTWNEPEGGLFIWCTLPEGADMLGFCKEAVETYRVAVVPGTAFLTDESAPCSSFRLNFSTPTDQQLVEGMEKLGKAAAKYLTV
ncbi:PLP-dependent aminotransferase family protein [Solibaculum mannosilyticum]|uniref:Aminotransferase n=1 Tax=Solibaculum mannosilyticum TaxID=2780922 RepID=A0A7I8CZS8_9FIRM|nr:PLP-dependent aminotransferase family protein [Solibaculum mannosilyticum]BCI59997.1 aminotransferase [Solibaculum mannosilyticum]